MSTAVAASTRTDSHPMDSSPAIPSPHTRRPSPKSAVTSAERPDTAARGSAADPTPRAFSGSEPAAKAPSMAESKRSPTSARNPPRIVVKNEPPSSPDAPASARHRPRKLDLATNSTHHPQPASARPSAPLTSRESGSLAMHDVGLACLSPGFQTQDPSMQQQLQRSISVRDQQRHIIESRLQKTARPSDPDARGAAESSATAPMKTPSSSKKRPPNGLSIVPPSHEQFSHERVIQSAPLNQSFTGRHQPHPITRHVANHPSNLSATSHIHQPPHAQPSNRLPPISDVFAADGLGMQRREGQQPLLQPTPSSTGYRPSNAMSAQASGTLPLSATQRPRDYRSAEEAVADMAAGREELLPKLIHYNGNNTPPSPPVNSESMPHRQSLHYSGPDSSRSARRRPRGEYERDMGSPPLGSGPDSRDRRSIHGLGIESPEAQRRKKDEFLRLCARAWDLFHY